MSKVSSTHFLKCRAESLLGISKQYEALAKMCRKLDITPLSGDLMSQEEWRQSTSVLDDRYCPSEKNGSIILTLGQFVIAALVVNNGSLYCATLLGGNHDMSISELENHISRIRNRTSLRV